MLISHEAGHCLTIDHDEPHSRHQRHAHEPLRDAHAPHARARTPRPPRRAAVSAASARRPSLNSLERGGGNAFAHYPAATLLTFGTKQEHSSCVVPYSPGGKP